MGRKLTTYTYTTEVWTRLSAFVKSHHISSSNLKNKKCEFFFDDEIMDLHEKNPGKLKIKENPAKNQGTYR